VSNLATLSDVAAFLVDVAAAPIHRYAVRDGDGRPLDCLKIQEDDGGGYLAVSHAQEGGRFDVHLHASGDLVTWTYVRTLARDGSQPTFERDGFGGWIVADEAMRPGKGNVLRFRRYPSTEALLAGAHDLETIPPNTLAARRGSQGTPNLVVHPGAGLDDTVIEVGFHAFDGRRDRQASGTLTGFAAWEARLRPDLDALFPDARGNIGDRDVFTLEGRGYAVHEVQGEVGDWGSWRVWLRDLADEAVAPIRVRTHGGSAAFGNPTVTALALPDGRPGLVLTLYVFGDGAAPGERGPLVAAFPFPPAVATRDLDR
jgi:hypothetical protein